MTSFMVWEGDLASFQLFQEDLNSNDNISLSWNVDKECMVFLDLEVYKESYHSEPVP